MHILGTAVHIIIIVGYIFCRCACYSLVLVRSIRIRIGLVFADTLLLVVCANNAIIGNEYHNEFHDHVINDSTMYGGLINPQCMHSTGYSTLYVASEPRPSTSMRA